MFAAALREDEVARVAITRCNRLVAIGRFVIAIMTTETAIPVFVSNVVGMGAPAGLHLGEEILAIDCLVRCVLLCSYCAVAGKSCSIGRWNIRFG